MRAATLLGWMVQRLRHSWRAALVFALLGAINSICLARLPILLAEAQAGGPGFLYRLFYHFLAAFLSALIVALFLRLCTDSGANMVRRPLRFLLCMMLAAVLATGVGIVVTHLFNPAPGPWRLPDAAPFLEAWLETMLWGSLLGWLYFLFLQKLEDRATFSALLCQRALLARQLAQSELLTMRTQIDPDFLTRILRAVHAHYPHAPHEAGQLLDQLIAWLRLAMQRPGPASNPSTLQTAMELALQTILNDLAALESRQ